MKRKVQSDIGYFINTLPEYGGAVRIGFTWYEGDRKRDPDNICFAKKFILDSLVECGRIKNDNSYTLFGFADRFVWNSGEYKVVLEIEEVEK